MAPPDGTTGRHGKKSDLHSGHFRAFPPPPINYPTHIRCFGAILAKNLAEQANPTASLLAQRRAYFRPQKPPRAVRWCSRELRVCSRRSISPAPTGAANKGIETDTLQAMVSHNGGGGAWSLARQECAQRRAERQGTRLPCPLNAPARLLRSIWRFETSADEIILASPGPPKPPGGPWSRVTRSEISRRGPARRRIDRHRVPTRVW